MRQSSQKEPYGSPTGEIDMDRRCTIGTSDKPQIWRAVERPKSVKIYSFYSAEKNPISFRAQINLATYYEAVNQTDKAAKAFEAALALRPKDGITRQRYAQMLIRGGRADAAVTQYTDTAQG